MPKFTQHAHLVIVLISYFKSSFENDLVRTFHFSAYLSRVTAQVLIITFHLNVTWQSAIVVNASRDYELCC